LANSESNNNFLLFLFYSISISFFYILVPIIGIRALSGEEMEEQMENLEKKFDQIKLKSCKMEIIEDYVLNVGRGGERITSANSRILS